MLCNGCLIYTTVELQYDVEGNENGYRTQSLYAMDMDKNKTLIMTYKMGEFGAVDEAPIDLCEYGMDIIYCNYFGLFRVDGINYSINKVIKCWRDIFMCRKWKSILFWEFTIII